MKYYLPYLFFLCFTLMQISCQTERNSGDYVKGQKADTVMKQHRVQDTLKAVDLEQIKKDDTLRVAMNNSATSYFIYHGQPMGFEYDLLKRLSDHLQLTLEIVIENDSDDAIELLTDGEIDIVAHKMARNNKMDQIKFTDSNYQVQQVLVQRKPENWQKLPENKIENYLVRSIEMLPQLVLHLEDNPYTLKVIDSLSELTSFDIEHRIYKDQDAESLIKEVARGNIPYTIADEDVARVNQSYFPVLDVGTELSRPQKIAWAVRKTSPDLLKAVNSWLRQIKNTPDFNVIYRKYLQNSRLISRRVSSSVSTLYEKNRISRYDDLIQKAANELDWDWKLLSALIYEESRFDAKEKSWMGAVGLMQVLPATASMFGSYNLYVPWQNIQAGKQYLQWLEEYWQDKVPSADERLKFVLASYNVGPGHVRDAARLAEKYDKDPDRWSESVEYYLLRKSEREFYTDPVVKMGYCRGEEPVNYVKDIMFIYDIYSQLVRDNKLS